MPLLLLKKRGIKLNEILELDKETINRLKLQCSQATKKEKKEIVFSLCSLGLTPKEISKIVGISVKSAKGYIDFHIANGGEVKNRPTICDELLEDKETVNIEDENINDEEETEEETDELNFSSEIGRFNSMLDKGIDFFNFIIHDDIVLELSAYDKAIQLLKHRLENNLNVQQINEIALALYKAQNKRRTIKCMHDLRSVILSKVDDNCRDKIIDILNVLNKVGGEVVQSPVIYDNYSAQVKKSITKGQREIISELVNGVAGIKFEA